MELRRLRLLHELSRRGTIGAVAEALSYSPSSVSVQLAELEREAGTKLLRRVGRNVALTPAGWRLAEHAAEALRSDEAVRAELARLGEAPRGRVRMTFVQTPALALLSPTLATLAETAPGLRVEVVQRETAPAIEELRSRAIDVVVGIEYAPVPVPRHRDVDRQDLIEEDVLLIVPAGHPATTLEAVEGEPWAAGNPGTGHALLVENVCNRVGGYAPDVRHRSDDGLILRALVSSGQAVTLLPALTAATTPGVDAHRIPDLHRTIFTAVRSAAAQAPAVAAVRDALGSAAASATADRDDVRLVSAAYRPVRDPDRHGRARP